MKIITVPNWKVLERAKWDNAYATFSTVPGKEHMSCHYYRQTSFYFASLHCTLQHGTFYKLKFCGSPALCKSIGAIFPMACAHFVCLYHILVILAIFQAFSLLSYFLWSVISHTIHTTVTHWKFRWWLAFFRNNIFFN